MVRLVGAEGDEPILLAQIDATAFGDREAPWTPDDFRTTDALIIADDAVRKGLIVMQVAADQAEILNLAVVPQFRRGGLGAELLDTAEFVAAETGAVRMFLEVAVDNAPALALYQKAGYAEEGKRKSYYLRKDGRRIDALVLSKPLQRMAEACD